MTQIDVTVGGVAQQTHELLEGIGNLVYGVRTVTSDGFQAGSDIPAIITTALGQMAAINGVDQIGAEFKEDKVAFAKAVLAGGAKLADGILKPLPVQS